MLIDLATVSFAAILVAAGAAAFLLAVLHPPARTVPLMSFGAGVWMYGSRVFAELPAFRAVAPGDQVWWDHVVGILTYLLPVVTFLFTEHFLGAGWRSSIRRVWQGHLVFAVGAVAVDLVTRTPQASVTVSSVVVILEMGVVLANLVAGTFRIDHEVRIVRRALVVLVVSIANDNLVWLGLVPWRVLVEPLGVAIFIGALGYAVVLRSLGNERRLGILDHELQTARHIQRSLLPHDLSSAPGTELAARYVPMTAVGGDFYDTLPIGRQRLGLLVADVAGHGVPAALIASMVKTAAAAQRGVGDNPAAVLDGINKYLCGQIDGHYVTAVYVCIDTDEGCLKHASAGHPAPLLWSQQQGQVVEVGESGLLLGFVPEAEYTTTEVAFAPGDRLVLFTDGVVEATSPTGAFFDVSRLVEQLERQQTLSAEHWADRLLERLTEWTGRRSLELDDDLTLVVVDMAPGS